MKAVIDHIAARARSVHDHAFFNWLNASGRPLRDRFLFSPILAEFIMGFADMNKWFLSYEKPDDPLEAAINEHTEEDRTHSRLFVEDWAKLGLSERLGFTPSVTLWWWFDCTETELLRRLAMETLDLTVNNPDPLLRFALMQAIEACGDVFFGNTVSVAHELERETGLEYRYYGVHHRVRETGHLHTDEDVFTTVELGAEKRTAALALADRMIDMFIEELDHMAAYARRASEAPAELASDLARAYEKRLATSGGDASRWPTGPKAGSPKAPSQSRVEATLRARSDALARHRFLRWLRDESTIPPVEKLKRFAPLWAIDVLGYRDFNSYVLRYPDPRTPEERALNRWTTDLASHGILYLKDWVALGLDQSLPWPADRVIAYYFLSDHTELHRHAMARVKHHAFAFPRPNVRYWLIRALESGGEVLFHALLPLVERIEAQSPLRLDYWGHRHYVAQPHQPADAEADAVSFTGNELPAEAEQAALASIHCIFDNYEELFELSLRVALDDYYNRTGARDPLVSAAAPASTPPPP